MKKIKTQAELADSYARMKAPKSPEHKAKIAASVKATLAAQRQAYESEAAAEARISSADDSAE
jgi:hypothetical protein